MNAVIGLAQDAMQVCRNGHVITDRLHTVPEQALDHCDRCGAATYDRCLTCGCELPGAIPLPGLVPVGGRCPPQYCAACGAAFPWTQHALRATPSVPLRQLDTLLRRLPVAIRELRARHAERPPFRVEDVFDLEDLLRAVLPLDFGDVYSECRTPSYAAGTRTDFLLVTEAIVICTKFVHTEVNERQLEEQWREDVAYYDGHGRCRTLTGFVYDPQGRLSEPRRLETAWAQPNSDLRLKFVVAS